MLPEASIAITKSCSLAMPVNWNLAPEIDKTKNKTTKHLKINKKKFLDNIFLPENLSMASKLAKAKAFFFVNFRLKKCIKIKRGITTKNHKYCGFIKTKRILFPSLSKIIILV